VLVVAVEVDGPSRFLLPDWRRASGATLLKRRILSMLGYHVISVPHWEWNALKMTGAKDEYMRKALGMTWVD
jgi:hypothetical protein